MKIKGNEKKLILPVILLTMVTLVTAAFIVVNATINIHVNEALMVEYAYVDDAVCEDIICEEQIYTSISGTPEFWINGYPRDSAAVCIKICNVGNHGLPYNVDVTNWYSAHVTITTTSGCDSGTIAAGDCVYCCISGTINDDAKPGDYTETIKITRG